MFHAPSKTINNIRRVALIAFIVVGAGYCVHWLVGPTEPRYKGRALSEWLDDLNEDKAEGVRQRAKAILTQAATEAAPVFIKTLRTKDSRFKQSVMLLAQKARILKLSLRTADMRHEDAIREYSRFAAGGIPVLTNLLHDQELAVQAMRTLSSTGPEAAVHLISALNHTNDAMRILAIDGLVNIYMNGVQLKNFVRTPGWLGNFPTNATVEAALGCLKDTNAHVRASGAFLLGIMQEQPETVIPALVENLEPTNPSQVRQSAVDALRRFGEHSVSAAVPLWFLLCDEDPAVRNEARNAVRRINRLPKSRDSLP